MNSWSSPFSSTSFACSVISACMCHVRFIWKSSSLSEWLTTQPKLESLPSSATDGNPAGQYTHLLQLKNASSEDKTPDALRAALSKDIHERLLTDFNLFERNRGDLSADDWAALSKSDVVDRWLTRTIKGFDVSELANKAHAVL